MRKNAHKSGMGIGYVTLIMVFAVICLTILAVLAFQSASSNEKLSERNGKFTYDYYAADVEAKQILMRLDNAALTALGEAFFEDSFPALAEEENVAVTRVMDGFRTEYAVPLNERLELSVAVVFYSEPSAHEGKRFEISEWKTTTVTEAEDSPLNVWDGSF